MSQVMKPVTLQLHEDSEGRLVDLPLSRLPHGIAVITGAVTARDPCPTHGYAHWDNLKALPRTRLQKILGRRATMVTDPNKDCEGGIIGRVVKDFDMSVKAFAQMTQVNIFALTSASITDTGNTSRTVNANQACTAPTVVAGTGSTAPAFTDYHLQSQSASTSGSQAATVNAISSNTYTITATITNSSGSTITYAELGMTVTNSTWVFLVAHDTINSGTGFPVSTTGTLSCTYTLTFT